MICMRTSRQTPELSYLAKLAKKTIKNKNGEQENGELGNAKKIW